MISLSDTTLRDGAQAEGVSFSMDDKIRIIQALDDLGIRYIEAGNPGANALDAQLFSALKALPKLRCASLLAFGSTCRPGLRPEEDEALCRLRDSGADISVIFGKSGPRQSERILRISPEDNLRLIADTVQFLKKNGTPVWYDAEHFFDAWRKSRDYAMKTLDAAAGAGAARLILCDTRGGSFPEEIAEAVVSDWNTQLGIDSITVEKVENFFAARNDGDFDLAYYGWFMDYTDLSNMFGCVMNMETSNCHWTDEEYVEAYNAAISTADQAEQWENYKKCEAVLAKDLPVTPILHSMSSYLFDDVNYSGLIYSCGNFVFTYLTQN